MPRTQIATPDLTALFSGGVAPPAFELRENRCETTDIANDRAPYVQSSGLPVCTTMPWKTDRTSPALEAVDGVVADLKRPLYGQDAHRHQLVDLVHHADLGSPLPWSGGSGQYLRESYPLRAPVWRPNVAGASTWKGVVGLVNNQRTCEVAAH